MSLPYVLPMFLLTQAPSLRSRWKFVRIPPTLYYFARLYWRCVWEAAPYERNGNFPVCSIALKRRRLFGRFEEPGDSHASVRYFSE